jgi:hypothetical protein
MQSEFPGLPPAPVVAAPRLQVSVPAAPSQRMDAPPTESKKKKKKGKGTDLKDLAVRVV